MSTEIERKYLLKNENWRNGVAGIEYRQGYIHSSAEATVRVRIAGDKGFLTIKGKTKGCSRDEFEYAIPVGDAAQMLEKLCKKPLIEKRRYKVAWGGHLWEIDEFFGENEGLVVAEVELGSADEVVKLPPWVGIEVSSDLRYQNANLSVNPYRNWKVGDGG